MEFKISSLETIDVVAQEFVREAMQEDTVFAFRGAMGAGKTAAAAIDEYINNK